MLRTALLLSAAAMMTGGALAASRGMEAVPLRQYEAYDAPIVSHQRLYGNSYALVIGIDDYTAGWPRLGMAVADARAVAKELTARGFDVTLVLNPDSERLETAFEDFFYNRGADPEARLFVWFAGHGETLGHGPAAEGYLAPKDAPLSSNRGFLRKAVSLRDFGKWMRQVQSKHVFAVFDACFAGTIFNKTRSLPPKAITLSTTKTVRQFVTAGDVGQVVADNGRVRRLFLAALDGEYPRADANGDGYLTGSELGLFLEDSVTNYSNGAQTPRWGKMQAEGYDRGDFVFALRPPAAITPPVNNDIIVDANGGGQYRSIQNAINAAPEGATIRVRPGTYREGMVVDKPLEIIGDGPRERIVVESPLGVSALKWTARSGRVAGLTLKQTGGESANGAWIEGGALTLEDNAITSQSYSNIEVSNGANPIIRRNRIYDGPIGGILIRSNSKGQIIDNEITTAGTSGIEIKTGSDPIVMRNRITGNVGAGVNVLENGKGRIEDNDINSNENAGIAIKAGGNPNVTRNRITSNTYSGVHVYENGKGRIEDNDITGNKSVGIEIRTGGDPVVTRNRISGSGYQAVRIYEDGRGTITDNDLRNNTRGSFLIQDSAGPYVRSGNLTD